MLEEQKKEKRELEEIEQLKKLNKKRARYRSRERRKEINGNLSIENRPTKKVIIPNNEEEDEHSDLGDRSKDFLAQREKKILVLKKAE